VKNLRFYNKEGYPYNFQYNDDTEKWEGKMLFDPNSSDLYKTIGIYLFEHVEPISFADYFNFNKFEIYNDSGIIFKGSTKQGLNIENIQKTNNSSAFKTKWIKGKGFHQIFPEGTVVRFVLSGANYTDFADDLYFNVLETRKNEILVQTQTTNDIFAAFTYTSGKIYSCDVIKYPDYNQGYGAMFSSKIYVGKQLSVVNSDKNSGVVEVKDYEVLKRNIYDFELSGTTNDKLNLEITLLTDRILLHNGVVNIIGNKFIFSQPFGDTFNIGQNIIFEDYNGNQLLNGYQYTITSISDNISVKTGVNLEFFEYYDENTTDETEYYIRTTSTLNVQLVANDIIYFTGASLNIQKDFKVLYTYQEDGYTYIQLEQHVHEENVTNMSIVKRLRFYEYFTLDASGIPLTQTIDGNCFLTTNILNYKQDIIPAASGYTTYHETINAFVKNFNNDLNKLGINSYLLNDKLIIEGLYDYTYAPYFTVTLYLENDGVNVGTIPNQNTYSSASVSDIHYIFTEEKIYNEKIYLYETNKLSSNYNEEIIFDLYNDVLDYGFNLTLNDVEYFINYQDSTGTTNNTQETIKDFVEKYYTALYNKGIEIFTGTTVDNKLYIQTLYPDIQILSLKIKVNTYSSYNILYQSENEFKTNGIIISGNQLDISMMGSTNLFDIGLSTGMIFSVSGSSYNENEKEYNILGLTTNTIQLSYQGAFFEENNILLDIDSREYIRKPRLSYNKDIYYRFSWITSDEHLIDESIFFYDISGEQLQPPKDNSGNYIEKLRYIGQKPIWDSKQQNIIRLNKEPNNKLEYISNPKYQQTIFSELNFLLPQLDSDDDFNYLPKPFEIFIGYNTLNEGVNYNMMKIEKVESVVFSGITGVSDNFFIFNTDGIIEFKSNTFDNFINLGFEIGQPIQIKMTDTNPYDQSLFKNYETYTIIDILKNKIVVDISNINDFVYFNSSGKTFNYSINVQPKEIGRFSIYGETEIEDERFDINLKNLGIRIHKEEEMIFKDSDLEENGIDYSLLNRKRKEMLIMYPHIYNYIGAYKSLMGAINFFGYNDLELYEYYKNVNSSSPFYKKYMRIYIPDIFDTTVDGWNEVDFIKNKGNRNNYVKSNLFNLTYKITDEDGYNLNLYSLKEVQIKLQKLKLWLRENVIPLSTNIIDITGSAKIPNTNYLVHDTSNQIKKLKTEKTGIVINFNHITTLNFSTNYLFSIFFYTVSGFIPDHFELIIKTFTKNAEGKLIPVQYFKVFKTDLEPFNFNIDKDVDPYIYIETSYYGDYGVGYRNTELFNFDEPKNYYLINNNFRYKYYPRISTNEGYYIIDDDGSLWIVEEYSNVINS
jgi:hypothetical protein